MKHSTPTKPKTKTPRKSTKTVEHHAKPTPEKKPIEAQPAAPVEDNDQKIADLQTAIDDLLVPVPQPYPKWVVIDGVSQIVGTLEEEQRKIKDAAAKKDDHAD